LPFFLLLAIGLAAPLPCGHAPQAELAGPAVAAQQTPSTSAPAEKLEHPGLPNLGRVVPNLYRGGQPHAHGYDELRRLRVDIVVNLNTSRSQIAHEKIEVESRSMRYVSIPWSASSVPGDTQVAEFLRLIRDSPDKTIFVHCYRGADRTGVMVAIFRMARQGWTPELALDEMQRFNFHGFWYRHLKRYVNQFPAKLKATPMLLEDSQPVTPQ
jgi:protein tyrosine/serine phosphatase